jgi:hypothetical protein
MPDVKNITDVLQAILDAKIDPGYESEIGPEISLVRAFVRSLLALNVGEFARPLPNVRPNYAQYRMDPAPYRETMDIRIRRAFANETAAGLQNVMGALGTLPTNEANRTNNIGAFLRQTQAFFDTWGFLLPAIQAVRASSPIDEFIRSSKDIAHVRDEANKVLASLRETAEKVGASKHAKHFNDLAEKYRSRAIASLWCTIFVAVLFVGLVVATGYWTISIPKDEYGKLVQVVVGKVLGLGVVYYMLLLAARSYRSNTHLAAVNLHRTVALQTLETFVSAATDEQTKDAVLLETTRCIYSATNTGFIGAEETSPPIQIVEILKALGSHKH